MQIKEREASPKHFHLHNDKGGLTGFQQSLEHYFFKFLSQSDTCQ